MSENVATITLNRPDALNAISGEMAHELSWAWQTVRDTDDIHVAVLRAAEIARSARASTSRGRQLVLQIQRVEHVRSGHRRLPKITHRCWKPVVTAVNGLAAGGASTSSTSPTS